MTTATLNPVIGQEELTQQDVTQFDLRQALQEIQAEEETDQIRLFIPRKPR